MSISCIPPSVYNKTGIVAAIPGVLDRNISSKSEIQTVSEGDVLSSGIIRIFFFFSDIVGFDYADTTHLILSFASIEALTNSTIYEEMIINNQLSLGRLTRDFMVCDFEDTIYCKKKNIKLLDSFIAIFIILLVISYTIPIPSVLYYFMWVFGLSYGVLYFSYNFSFLCFPRIPTCLGTGIHELSQMIFPSSIYMPKSLYDNVK